MMVKKLFRRLCEEAEAQVSAGAPAATPQEPSAPVEESFDDAGADWADLSGEEEPAVADEWSEEAPPAAAETEATPPPETPPATEQPAAEQPLQPELAAPEQPVQYTNEQRQLAEQAYMGQLANLYTFDEETALKLQTEPEKVLPVLAAKLHMDVMKTVLAQVNGMLPQVMQQQTQVVERNSKAQELFFGQWPELKGYEKQVLEVGRMFRQINPQANTQEAVQKIGETTLAALGLQRAQAGNPPPTQIPPQQGFRPSVPGRVNAPARSLTEWETLLDEDD